MVSGAEVEPAADEADEAGAADWRAWLPWIPALIAGVILVGTVLTGFGLRLGYPYDLEWMEGGQLAHAWRVQHGLPLYPEPGPDWVPYIYPPGHPLLLAGLGWITGLSAPVGRAVSWLGTALAVGSIVALVVRQGRGPARWFAGALGGAVYLACWWPSGAFLDLVRPDALGIGLLLLCLVLSLERDARLQIAGGLLLAAAFFVKHNLAAFGLPLVLGLWIRDRGVAGALRVGLSALVPAALGVAVAHALGENLVQYLLLVPASHGVKVPRMVPGTPWELGRALPLVALGVAAVGVAWVGRGLGSRARWGIGLGVGLGAVGLGAASLLLPDVAGVRTELPERVAGMAAVVGLLAVPVLAGLRGERGPRSAWLGILLGATGLGLAIWMRGHVGGFVNVHLPAFALLAVGSGLGAAWLGRHRLGAWLASGVLAAQLLLSWWQLPLAELVPSQGDVQAGDRVVDELRRREGPVWSPIAPWMAVQAGHEPGPHLIAVWDVSHRAGPFPGARGRFRDAVREGHWPTIVQGRRPVRYGIDAHYRQDHRFPDLRAGVPRTGWRNRPGSVWVPAPRRGAPSDAGAPPR